MPYPELKEKILKELKMTPNEYRRLFLSVKKEQDDSWHQVATRLETLFSYYLKSRDVTTLKDLKDLVIADRFKQILSEDVRTYVMQNEVTHWLVASEIAELAETYEESRRVGWTRERSDKPLCEGDRRVGKTSGQTGNAGKKTRTEAIRCFQCKKFGHYASNCPDPRHGFEKVQPEEENSKIVARAEIIVSDSFRPQVEQCDKVNQQAASEVLNWVDLEVGGNSVRACLDSGAEITVLRTETVPEACKGKSSGKIKLKGAFGQVVDADLLYLPLSLAGEDGCRHQQVLILCAVTDVLSKGIGALLTPEAHELLESAKMELEEEAQDRATLEQAFITTENAVADWPEWGPELDDDEEAEEGVMVASVGLAGNEAMGSDDASPAARFRVEQKEDNSLGEAWKQAVDDHMQHLGKVLATLKQVGLTANPAKCKFAQTKVKYLGHVVGSGTHSPDPDRVSAIFKLQAPKTKRDLRSVLGLFNYYREYIPEYSKVVRPLTDLTARRIPKVIPWNEEAENAFCAVKNVLASLPQLVAPDHDNEFLLTTDASEIAVGACLSQLVEGEQKPVAFLSKKLTASQAKWSAIEREAFAVVWALGRLDTWLFGAKIKVATDHNPLTFLAGSASTSPRLMRWSLALQKYELEIVHIKGTANRCADALSRLDDGEGE
ncbi:uncharacterized protein [Dermacentor albipictus]|uniref:uncharacterized protein n=1 Tax=Dermacentor albipictus TaxID=60249 RepID=UPI0038FC22E8